jgi:hypothetical protein
MWRDATEPRCVTSTTRANFVARDAAGSGGRLHAGRDGNGSPRPAPDSVSADGDLLHAAVAGA